MAKEMIMDDKIHHALSRARELIDTPEKWIQNNTAVDVDDNRVDILSEKACKFCLGGAIDRVRSDMGEPPAFYTECSQWIKENVELGIYGTQKLTPLVSFNDQPTTTHADVLRAIDEAIQPFLEE